MCQSYSFPSIQMLSTNFVVIYALFCYVFVVYKPPQFAWQVKKRHLWTIALEKNTTTTATLGIAEMPSFDFLVNNTEQSSSGFVDGSIRSSALFIVCDGLFPTYNRWFFLVIVFHGLWVSISMAAYIEFQLFIKNHPKKVSELNLKSK